MHPHATCSFRKRRPSSTSFKKRRTGAMNWMTSGRHRALHSQRAQRRHMHFPSQVQRQRVTSSDPPRSSQPVTGCDSTTPWYIVPVGGDNESQDIRVLELERKGALSTEESTETTKTSEDVNAGEMKSFGEDCDSRLKTRSSRQEGQDALKEPSESRCIFTPVKKTRKGASRCGKGMQQYHSDRPPSSIASGADLLFFNDGEELPHKTRVKSAPSASVDFASHHSMERENRFSQHSGENQDADSPLKYSEIERLYRLSAEPSLCSAGEDSSSVYGCRVFTDRTNKTSLKEFSCQNAGLPAAVMYPDSSLNKTFVDTEGTCTGITYLTTHGNHCVSPPPTPLVCSPPLFRMSRAEVIQSQLSTSIPMEATYGEQVRFADSPHLSASQSTPTSSQGSIVLGRPPLGWQKRLLFLQETNGEKHEQPFSNPSTSDLNSSSSSDIANKIQTSDPISEYTRKRHQQLSPSPSPRSSPESDGAISGIDALVPIDAKERIAKAVYLQRPLDDAWTGSSMRKIDSAGSCVGRNNMAFQQSWVMASRTKAILDAALAKSNAPCTESLANKCDAKFQEVESVAIYMYTLVQCYKIDERLRADVPSSPLPQLTQLSSSPDPQLANLSVIKPTACRREVIFSPKHMN